nr:MAG TPA: Terminase small subunit [Caudoviricetes sp.]
MALNHKQKQFYKEWLIDANATQAAIRAGYSKKTAYSQGQRLLKNVEGQKYLAELMAEKESELIASQDEVLKYLTSVMRGKSQSTEIVVEGIGDGCSEARTVLKEPSEKERLKAAELLGKRYGLYTDKIETDVDMELNITVDYGDGEADCL